MPPVNAAVQLDIQSVTLKDGTQLTIRAILPEDAARLQSFHQRLTPDTIYLRYLEYHKILTDEEAAHFCTVDTHNRMAFVATRFEGDEEIIVGVIRYEKLGATGLQSAEMAILIDDAYQHRGLGSILLNKLVDYARSEGIHVFTASFLFENTGFMSLIRHSGLRMSLKAADVGTYEARILLNSPLLN
jgi:GNAT superfamily N-acetyltransferase